MPRRLIRSAARTAGRTALIAGTATAVSGRVARRRNQHLKAEQTMSAPARDTRSGTGPDDIVGRLQKLADLRASGALSDKEFAEAKGKVLHG